ncbi:MAG TPA: class I SAM-dependent methyltransferase [Nocardioidaceae bacterium]|nr:class I SAM-dependent methyltransferase [Nocardioidaceae bacterium]
MNSIGRCPACDSDQVQDLATIGPVPVLCGSLWPTRDEALTTPTADLALACCLRCAHVWNWCFDPTLVEYDAQYDNALDFSATFRAYAEGLVDHLVEAFELQGKRLVEIGSGKGEFLRQLCAAGGNTGLGYDPTYEGPDEADGIRFVRTFFTPGTAVDDVDFVCCRHVLEHLADPYGALLDMRKAVQDRPVPMYFEVPNAEFNFSESGPWDLIYPHVAYFSDISLRALLVRSGFRVLRLDPVFGGQFLGAEVVVDTAALSADDEQCRARGAALARFYRDALDRQLTETKGWQRRLDRLLESGQVALWGAGSKGVTFLSLVDRGHKVATVVDANPRKWGRFLPGCGHQVVAPDEVVNRSAHAVIVMNPAYTEEIKGSIAELGSRADVLVV